MTAEDLLREARALIRDMDNGWPRKELHRPPDDLCAEITGLLGDNYNYETGDEE